MKGQAEEGKKEGTMKIFDGVKVNPASLSPKWQGVLGVAMLLASGLAEAEKIRNERVTKEATQRTQATTLEDVMEQSGLKIAKLHDALEAFMGGDEEAKEVADLIVSTPDPGKLLLEFAKNFKKATVPTTGPIVTPPPSAPATMPLPAQPPATPENAAPRLHVAEFRPEFTREGMAAGLHQAAPADRPKPSEFRPEFTREGMASGLHLVKPAARAPEATAVSPSPSPPTTAAASMTGPTRPRALTRVVAARLAAGRRKIEAEQADLESRIRCIEAEMELLRLAWAEQHPMGGTQPKLVIVAPEDDTSTQPPLAPEPGPGLVTDTQDKAPEVHPGEAATDALAEVTPAAESTATETATGERANPSTAISAEPADAAPILADEAADLPDAESEEEVEEVLSMIDAFTDDVSAQHAKASARLGLLERQLSAMRAMVSGERGRGASHG
jgi:hypothetical protein